MGQLILDHSLDLIFLAFLLPYGYILHTKYFRTNDMSDMDVADLYTRRQMDLKYAASKGRNRGNAR